MVAVISLFLIIALSMIVTKVAAAFLVHTGLSRDMARFQARSAFTGAGFTTNESEQIVAHPLRRKIVTVLMILGNAGLVTAVSSLIIGFLNTGLRVGALRFGILMIAVAIMMALISTKWFDRRVSLVVAWLMKHSGRLALGDYASLLNISGDYRVAEFEVASGHWMAGKALEDMRLNREGIIVLGIHRGDGNFIGTPRGDTVVHADDSLVNYGKRERITALRERSRATGEEEHRKTEVAHAREVREQEQEDRDF